MKDILTDLYNKVINFFQSEKIEGENTKETAKSRLRLVLMQDRSNLEPETMAQLREELIEVISKYIVMSQIVKYIVIACVWVFGMIMIKLYAPADTESVPILQEKVRKKK